MIPLKKALESSIGKKFVMSISGIALVGFIIVHLLGNLPLYLKAEQAGPMLNEYSAFLASFGWLLTAAEIGLAAAFIIHMVYAIRTTLINKKARKNSYDKGVVSKGGPSHLTLLSRNMIFSGVVIGVFLIVHLWQFRFSKGSMEPIKLASGADGLDLYAVVAQTFSQPVNVIFYTIVMLILGAHLSHGLWSALQSLGAMKPAWSKAIYTVGILIAVVLAAGFLFIPIVMFLTQSGV